MHSAVPGAKVLIERAEARLLDNVEGFEWFTSDPSGMPIPKPSPRTP